MKVLDISFYYYQSCRRVGGKHPSTKGTVLGIEHYDVKQDRIDRHFSAKMIKSSLHRKRSISRRVPFSMLAGPNNQLHNVVNRASDYDVICSAPKGKLRC